MRICGGPPSARVRGVQKGTVPMPKDMRTEKHHQTILPSSAGLTEQTPPAVFGTRLLLYQILLQCQAFLQNSISFFRFHGIAAQGGAYQQISLHWYWESKEGKDSPSLSSQIIFAVFIFTPGPMVEATTQLLIYWPLAAAGLAFTMAPIRAL